jgi:hypothetical protein
MLPKLIAVAGEKWTVVLSRMGLCRIMAYQDPVKACLDQMKGVQDLKTAVCIRALKRSMV